jgi:hypothetical protein
VLALAGAGLATVALDHFRRGTVLFSLALCLAAALRAVLPERSVGLLRVRSRLVDVVCLAALGGAALVLSLAVPPPS